MAGTAERLLQIPADRVAVECSLAVPEGTRGIAVSAHGSDLTPKLDCREGGIPFAVVLVVLVVGVMVGGALGAIVAVPIAGGLRILTLRLVAPPVHEWTRRVERRYHERHSREAQSESRRSRAGSPATRSTPTST